MSIPLKRFQSLDTDFHVGVADFKSIIDDSKGAINIADDFIAEKTATLDAAIGQLKKELVEAKGAKDAIMGSINGAMDDATRFTKGLTGDITDMTKIPEKYINGAIDDIFGTSDGLGAKMKGLVKTCRNQSLSKARLGSKGFKKPMCNGLSMSAGNCSASGASGILSSATAGVFSKAFNAVGNIISKVMALANLGFNANLCNVLGSIMDTAFGAVGSIFDSVLASIGVKTLITGTLANTQALLGNISAIADVAKNATGLNVADYLPATARNVLGAVSGVAGMVSGLPGIASSKSIGYNQDLLLEGRAMLGATELLDPFAFTSKDGYPSTESFSNASASLRTASAPATTGSVQYVDYTPTATRVANKADAKNSIPDMTAPSGSTGSTVAWFA